MNTVTPDLQSNDLIIFAAVTPIHTPLPRYQLR